MDENGNATPEALKEHANKASTLAEAEEPAECDRRGIVLPQRAKVGGIITPQ